MSSKTDVAEHAAATGCRLCVDWGEPSDIQEMICTHCCLSNVVLIGENHPYHERHWQCENCDSTFADWIYPLNLGQRCESRNHTSASIAIGPGNA